MPNITYTINLTHDELVLIFLGLANSPEEMDEHLTRARRLFTDIKDKLPVNYKEISPEIDHGWSTHSIIYKKIFNAIREGKCD